MGKYKSADIPQATIAKLPPQAKARFEAFKKFSNDFTRDFDNDIDGDLLAQEDALAYDCIMGSSKSDTSPNAPKAEPVKSDTNEPYYSPKYKELYEREQALSRKINSLHEDIEKYRVGAEHEEVDGRNMVAMQRRKFKSEIDAIEHDIKVSEQELEEIFELMQKEFDSTQKGASKPQSAEPKPKPKPKAEPKTLSKTDEAAWIEKKINGYNILLKMANSEKNVEEAAWIAKKINGYKILLKQLKY